MHVERHAVVQGPPQSLCLWDHGVAAGVFARNVLPIAISQADLRLGEFEVLGLHLDVGQHMAEPAGEDGSRPLRRLVRIGTPERGQRSVAVVKTRDALGELPQVVATIGAAAGTADHLNGRQQYGHQHGQDRHDDQEFDERERSRDATPLAGSHASPSSRNELMPGTPKDLIGRPGDPSPHRIVRLARGIVKRENSGHGCRLASPSGLARLWHRPVPGSGRASCPPV